MEAIIALPVPSETLQSPTLPKVDPALGQICYAITHLDEVRFCLDADNLPREVWGKISVPNSSTVQEIAKIQNLSPDEVRLIERMGKAQIAIREAPSSLAFISRVSALSGALLGLHRRQSGNDITSGITMPPRKKPPIT